MFAIVTSVDERDRVRGSKYVQSDPRNIFKDALNWLRDHPQKELLFVGTGCQADAFRKYSEMVGIRDRVIVVDLICHGVPSPKLWKEYIDSFGAATYITFKDKRYGWLQPTAFIKIGEKEISLSEYVKVFYNHCALRPCCYECPYASVVRQSDITIGDYWGIDKAIPDFFSKEGTSLILIHTANGINVWNQICDSLVYRQSDVKACLQPNLIHPTEKSKYRKLFWRDYYKHGALYVVKNMVTLIMNWGLKIISKEF